MLSTRTKACLVLATLVCLVACGSLLPRQSWDEERLGPVIPHDTFPADCSMCHEGGSWTKVRSDFEFDHLAETGVPLNGAHAEAACLRCHNDRGPVEMFASRGCAGCHEDIHRGRLGPTCEQCHNEETWQPIEAIALHASTRFPLVGPHASAECFVCHEGAQVGNFEGLDPACEVCHTADLARAVNPDHIANGWISDCQRCHSQFAFQPADFVHPSSFPLTSSHGGLDCSECHTPGDFTGLSTDCAFCHTPEYNATTDPNHMAAGFSTDCAECHDTTTWGGAGFIHTPTFPLNGGHNTDNCSLCHTGGVFTGTPTDCVACHLPEFNATTSPNHVTSGFGTDCAQCHDIFGWEGADFEHTPTFPLTNGHDLPDCMQCHVGGVFTGPSTDCSFCHTPDFNATTDPHHASAGFSLDCAMCHETVTWDESTFVHTPSFPLTNGHNIPGCNVCHVGNVFAGLPADCVSCHLPEYNATTNPDHAASGFPTDCAQCHDTTNWNNANFNHSFPIDSGAHRNLDCIDCHTVPANTPDFTCIECHEHRQSSMDNEHGGVPGYVWESMACLNCHPNGRD